MLLKYFKVILASALFLSSLSANALLIDHGTYTTDDASGLDWLDVTQTANLSFEYVSGQLGVQGEYHGWRYATLFQLTELLANSGSPEALGQVRGELNEVQQQSAADAVTSMLGSTIDVHYQNAIGQTINEYQAWPENAYAETFGFLDNDGLATGNRRLAGIIDCDYIGCGEVMADSFSSFTAAPTFITNSYGIGSFLIRDTVWEVSEPSPLILMLITLPLIYMRKKK